MSRARRHRNRREEEVDASLGKLGADFEEEELLKNGGEVLNISEVHLLLRRELERGANGEPMNRDLMTLPVFKKCFEYCETFNRVKDESTVEQIRNELREYASFERQGDENGEIIDEKRLLLSRFEMAQLANLSIERAEEAKVLIPT
ncbi:hypothetical protein L7F22_009675 [Adiantum nelumboides]|nr:hypothetical protein [Adiantum nelumboides]